jgi:uncharacterized membrane protein YfbV (UPF0208 family)
MSGSLGAGRFVRSGPLWWVGAAVAQTSLEVSEMSWYYCLVHQRVEPEDGCPNVERMGPYATEADAAHALETAKERSEAYDAGED